MANPGLNFLYIITSFAIVVVSYLIGAFPHLLLLCKLRRIETAGDLHINLWRNSGPFWGLGSIIIDILKGTASVWLSRSLGFDPAVVVICGLAAVAGQMWPVFNKFNGEKGNTTGLGMALALAIQPTLIVLVPVVFGLLSKLVKAFRLKGLPLKTRFKSGAGQSNVLPISVALALLILPTAAFLYREQTDVVIGFMALLAMIMTRRLTAGLTEDLKNRCNLKAVLWNRLIYDRSHI